MIRKKGIIVALICVASLSMIGCEKNNVEEKSVFTKVYKIISEDIDKGSSIFDERIIVEKYNKYGIQSIDGENIEEIIYDKIIRVSENSYYLEKEGKGVIKNIVNNRIIEVNEIEKISDDYLRVAYKGEFGIVDKNLNWILPLEYDYLDYNKEYVIVAKEGVIEVYDKEFKKLEIENNTRVILGIGKYLYSVKNNKLGVIDKNGKVIITPKYDNFLKLNDRDIMIGYKDGKSYLINLETKKEKLLDYENFGEESEGMILTLKDRKLGYIDIEGNEIIPNKYEAAFKVQMGSKYLQVKENEKWMLVNKKGEVYKELPYDDLGEYKDGYILVVSNNKLGYIDDEGNEKIVPQFIYATSFKNGYAVVGEESGFGVINKENEKVIPLIYDEVEIKDNYVYVKMDNKRGILDLNGHEILPVIYDELGDIENNILFYKKDNESGYMELITK